MEKDNILARLTTKCPFPEVFQDTEQTAWGSAGIPRLKIGHIRADHDGRHWWHTWWPCHAELADESAREEFAKTYTALIDDNALKDLDTLTQFCQSHPEACADPQFRQEYNFYLEGRVCNFWLRLITRSRDYNLYLNAFAKN